MFSVDLQANGSETAEGILVLKIAGGRNWNAVCFDDAKIENKTLMETMNSVCGELGFGYVRFAENFSLFLV